MGSQTGLDIFHSFLNQYRRLILIGIGSAVVPLAAALASLTPAWPSGIAGITSVAQLLVLALVFQLLRPAGRAAVNKVMIRSIIVLCVLLPIYAVVLDLSTFTEPLSKERFTAGFECTPKAKVNYGDSCPFLGLDQIKEAEYEEQRLWTPQSVSIMKSLILTLWLACFAALSTALGSFAVFQMKQTPAGTKQARQPK
jgi:hypothetical protein